MEDNLEFQVDLAVKSLKRDRTRNNGISGSKMDLTHKYKLESSYWSFEHPVTSLRLIQSEGGKPVLAVSTFSQNSKILFLDSESPYFNENNQIELRDRDSFYKTIDIDLHKDFATISKNNGKVLTACSDGGIRLWTADIDKKDNQNKFLYKFHGSKVNRARFVDNQGFFVSVCDGGLLNVIDIEKAKCLINMSKNEIPLTSIALHNNPAIVFTGDAVGYGVVWDLRVGKYICDFNNKSYKDESTGLTDKEAFPVSYRKDKVIHRHTAKITRSSFNTVGNLLVTGSENHMAFVWDMRKQSIIKRLPAHTKRLVYTAFVPNDDKTLITASSEGDIKMWDWYNSIQHNEIKGSYQKLSSLAFNPTNNTFICGYLNKKVELYN